MWQRAPGLAADVYRTTAHMPSAERFGLVAQMRRAAISVSSNLAEGCGRWSDTELRRFIRISQRSLAELECQLLLSQKLRWLDASNSRGMVGAIREIRGMLDQLHSRLVARRVPRPQTDSRLPTKTLDSKLSTLDSDSRLSTLEPTETLDSHSPTPSPTLVLNIALTGNIASGKSTVTELFRRWGATIVDADRLVREAQAPGSAVLRAIVDRFGMGVLRPDGALDRPALRAIVLADRSARADLNRLVHPEVHRLRRQRVAEARARGDRIVVNDIPLLFEASDPAEFDAIVLVDAPEEVRRARLLAARGLAPDEAERMLGMQLPSGPKRARSDYVIDNAGDHDALERRAREVWEALSARA